MSFAAGAGDVIKQARVCTHDWFFAARLPACLLSLRIVEDQQPSKES